MRNVKILYLWKHMHQSLNSASLSFVYINSGLSCISCNPLPAGFTGIDDPYEPPLNCEVCYCRLCTQTMLLGIKFFIRDQIHPQYLACLFFFFVPLWNLSFFSIFTDWNTTEWWGMPYTMWYGRASGILLGWERISAITVTSYLLSGSFDLSNFTSSRVKTSYF